MNEGYANMGVSFTLTNVTRTVNETLATGGDDETMKTSLRQGDYSTLNVYFQTDMGGGLLGYCYFPDYVVTGSPDFYLDGCIVLAGSVPGGSAVPYNEGKTVTHEVGHWFGLFHTFQSDVCGDEGDLVDDTPAEIEPTFGCPADGEKDSCQCQTGADPIHNYMDYADE
jgi:hypothetical protein